MGPPRGTDQPYRAGPILLLGRSVWRAITENSLDRPPVLSGGSRAHPSSAVNRAVSVGSVRRSHRATALLAVLDGPGAEIQFYEPLVRHSVSHEHGSDEVRN
jgi:hypothetical protein